MAKAYGFTEDGVKRIVDSVRRIERELQNLRSHRQRGGVSGDVTIIGKLDGTLARGSFGSPASATMSVWAEVSGTWQDTTDNVTIYDVGMIPSSKSPIASGTVVTAKFAGGQWIIDAADVC